jgi:hypothetical protein
MEPNAYRDDEDPNGYWQRRVIILAVGLVILGLLAWALSGSGGSKPTAAARQSALGQVRAANALPAAAYASSPAVPVPGVVAAPSFGSGSPGVPGSAGAFGSPGSPGASASPTTPGTGTSGASGKPAKAKKPAKVRSRVPQPRPGASCPAGSVVMTLFTGKPSYARGERPVFEVYAVSTEPVECVFRFGAGAVHVLITQHGRVVWNSAECMPTTIRRTRMVRGVPVQMSVAWNRRAGYGCRGWLPAHDSGRFTAVARAGGQSSPATTFELVRLPRASWSGYPLTRPGRRQEPGGSLPPPQR